MGLEGLSDWLDHMGLGHETGIGISEARGRLPRDLGAGPGGGASSAEDVMPQLWFEEVRTRLIRD